MDTWKTRLNGHWLDGIQSRLVLPTARTLYLAGAILSVLAALIGLLVALFFQLSAWQTASEKPLPEQVSEQPGAITYTRLDQRLSPPTNIRFVANAALLPAPLQETDVLGHLEADTPNGMAAYPGAFEIIGGKDAELFSEGDDSFSPKGTVLRPKPAMVSQINGLVPKLHTAAERSFNLKILARDVFGNRTPPTDLVVTLGYGPSPVNLPNIPLLTPAQEAAPGPDKLKEIAAELAKFADPSRSTPAYYDGYDYAMREPVRCGAEGDEQFITNYRLALDHARPHLGKAQLNPFYIGLCEAWTEAGKQASDAARASAVARAQVMSENAIGQASAAANRLVAITLRNAALLFVCGAIVAFMTIALFLAFLAMEGHSSAVRQAIELLATRSNFVDAHHPDPSVIARETHQSS